MDDQAPKTDRTQKVKYVDRELVWMLATMMCTYKEIADVVNLSEKTLQNKFGDLIEKGRSVGRKSLRRAQFEKAVQDKDPRMLIFLGKQYLNQKDAPEDKESNSPLPWQE